MSKGKTQVAGGVAAATEAEVAPELCREPEMEMMARNRRWCRVICVEQTTEGVVFAVERAEFVVGKVGEVDTV